MGPRDDQLTKADPTGEKRRAAKKAKRSKPKKPPGKKGDWTIPVAMTSAELDALSLELADGVMKIRRLNREIDDIKDAAKRRVKDRQEQIEELETETEEQARKREAGTEDREVRCWRAVEGDEIAYYDRDGVELHRHRAKPGEQQGLFGGTPTGKRGQLDELLAKARAYGETPPRLSAWVTRTPGWLPAPLQHPEPLIDLKHDPDEEPWTIWDSERYTPFYGPLSPGRTLAQLLLDYEPPPLPGPGYGEHLDEMIRRAREHGELAWSGHRVTWRHRDGYVRLMGVLRENADLKHTPKGKPVYLEPHQHQARQELVAKSDVTAGDGEPHLQFRELVDGDPTQLVSTCGAYQVRRAGTIDTGAFGVKESWIALHGEDRLHNADTGLNYPSPEAAIERCRDCARTLAEQREREAEARAIRSERVVLQQPRHGKRERQRQIERDTKPEKLRWRKTRGQDEWTPRDSAEPYRVVGIKDGSFDVRHIGETIATIRRGHGFSQRWHLQQAYAAVERHRVGERP